MGILGAMKAVKGLILETSFDWYRDNFLDLVDADNAVWRHRRRRKE